jgi:hypothetical protein
MDMPECKYAKRQFSQKRLENRFLFLIELNFTFARLRSTISEATLFQYAGKRKMTARISRI